MVKFYYHCNKHAYCIQTIAFLDKLIVTMVAYYTVKQILAFRIPQHITRPGIQCAQKFWNVKLKKNVVSGVQRLTKRLKIHI
jgi:hypothetical protein